MAAFKSPNDIANRALQHCGQTRLNPVTGLADGSKGAREISNCYDKLREAELQRRCWTFATRRQILRPLDDNTMLLVPGLWTPAATYFFGSIVADQSGDLWISRIPNNLNNDPLLTNYWEPYFGPLSVSLYNSATAYSSGEVVYTTPGNGTYKVYLSLQNGNGDDPGVATAYDATAVYSQNQVVTYLAVAYMSKINLNTNNTPTATPAIWLSGTTYTAGNTVTASDGYIYSSVAAGNIGRDPTLDAAGTYWTNTGLQSPWTTSFVGGSGSAKWLQIGGKAFPAGVGLTNLDVAYPLGAGPSSQSTTSNAYRLPAGYLRLAAQNPKPGMNSLGGPIGNPYNDWLIDGEYLISSDVGPLILRFVVNITDVSRMHTMFCEGLAARVGMEVCPSLTQSSAQVGLIAKVYDRWISEAGMVDAIEDGYSEPPEDELISVRL